jgi:hypothetical protein
MILDKRIEFADAVALNLGVAGSYQIGDVYDLGVARDPGNGSDLYLIVNVQTTATSGGAATLQINLITANNATLTAPTILLSSPVFAVAALIAGVNVWIVELPVEGIAYQRYIGLQQVTGVAAFTAGKIDGFTVLEASKWKALADAIN